MNLLFRYFPTGFFLFIAITFVFSSANATPTKEEKLEQVKKHVAQYCGSCHKVPPPGILPKKDWPRVVKLMAELAQERTGVEFIPKLIIQDITAFYYGSSPEKLPTLAYNNRISPLTFTPSGIGIKSKFPLVVKIQPVNLGINKGTEFLICDGEKNQIQLLSKNNNGWNEKVLAEIPIPVNTHAIDYDHDGDMDILVSALGHYPPSDVLAGKIILLEQTKHGVFDKKVILENIGRVVDAQAVDIDGDKDLDIVTAIFGGRNVGEVAWLENMGNGTHQKHTIIKIPGALNATPVDLNGDGHMDLVSLFTQENEAFIASINDGKGNFKPVKLAQAPHPMFGSTSMSLIDIDRDRDLDILFTNGDNFDLQEDPKPYHGVQWLENKGNLQFAFRDIGRFYGAVNAKGGDIDGDGDIDIVASSWSNYWEDEKRQSIMWYENIGQEKFIAHDLVNRPISVVPIELYDLDGDNHPEIIAGVFRATALTELVKGNPAKKSAAAVDRILSIKVTSQLILQ